MKGIILSILLLPGIVFANWNWKVKDARSYTAMTTEKIEVIIQKFPQILEGTTYTASDLEFVNVAETTFEWTGETVCAEDDERLLYFDLTYLACPKNDIANCIVQVRPLLKDEDPCL